MATSNFMMVEYRSGSLLVPTQDALREAFTLEKFQAWLDKHAEGDSYVGVALYSHYSPLAQYVADILDMDNSGAIDEYAYSNADFDGLFFTNEGGEELARLPFNSPLDWAKRFTTIMNDTFEYEDSEGNYHCPENPPDISPDEALDFLHRALQTVTIGCE